MSASVLVRSVLPGLVLISAAGLAQAQVAGNCEDDTLTPLEQRAACDAEIEAATDPLERARLLVERAGTYRREGDPAGAVDALADLAEADRLAPDMDPQLRADLLVERAEAHASEGDFETAMADVAEAERLAPTTRRRQSFAASSCPTKATSRAL
jgi:tetratricopeptide (TPR) repeat protein